MATQQSNRQKVAPNAPPPKILGTHPKKNMIGIVRQR
ncbi:hypothetical protein K3495_g2224 [Podosphaera aphanis]|nr:hypothetical protein K3495_g2224 [Podosphaera aphanis]